MAEGTAAGVEPRGRLPSQGLCRACGDHNRLEQASFAEPNNPRFDSVQNSHIQTSLYG